MRSHGIANFPDSGVFGPGSRVDPNSPQFQAAQRACQSLEPQGLAAGQESAARRQALLQFSACVRHHGVPDFPDPSTSKPTGPVISIFGIVLPSGMDPQSPVFRAAMQACQPLLPGGPPKGRPKTSWGGAL
jgi:hypothetical protein